MSCTLEMGIIFEETVSKKIDKSNVFISYNTQLYISNAFFLPLYLVGKTSFTTTAAPISDHATTTTKGVTEGGVCVCVFHFNFSLSHLHLLFILFQICGSSCLTTSGFVAPIMCLTNHKKNQTQYYVEHLMLPSLPLWRSDCQLQASPEGFQTTIMGWFS